MPGCRAARAGALIAATLVAAMAPDCAVAQATMTRDPRPEAWAKGVVVAGVPNLHRVAPDFYRSAQPNAAGFKALAETTGIKTVVSLRAFHSDRSLTMGTGLILVRIPMNTWNIKRADVVRALAEVEAARSRGPVLLHCQHGADRTGLIAALHRVLNEGWTRAAALDEMKNGRFGYHAVWGNIPSLLKNVDIAGLRRDVAARACLLRVAAGSAGSCAV
jgi:protein tyrosine/serine phosphatase